tara:strand:+ start:1932 stop:2873 length:942 start_codon:yes stop_codon:yes gene_type:complete
MKKTILAEAICLIGPTATGKTQICLELAQHLPIEVVSVDSALVYRHMNIGTAKPNIEELSQCPHHLINIIDPSEHYSAAQFRTDAEKLAKDIKIRGGIPVFSGGTMMYYKALKEGLNQLPVRNEGIRKEIDLEAKQHGWPYIHEKLRKIDPETAKRINPNDSQRIQRAIEVFNITGEPMSKLLSAKISNQTTIKTIDIALVPESRAELHKNIGLRFKNMIAIGLIEEVVQIKKRWDLSLEMTSMRCVGYRQVWEYLEGKYDEQTLIEKGSAATRQLAKRQLTWLRSFPIKHVLDPYSESTRPEILRLVKTLIS